MRSNPEVTRDIRTHALCHRHYQNRGAEPRDRAMRVGVYFVLGTTGGRASSTWMPLATALATSDSGLGLLPGSFRNSRRTRGFFVATSFNYMLPGI